MCGCRSPLTPTLSPLEKGGEGVGSGGMIRGTFRAPPPHRAGALRGWYRLKRKSVSGNGISLPCFTIFCEQYGSTGRRVLCASTMRLYAGIVWGVLIVANCK